MRLPSVVAGLFVAATAAPCLAQSLEVTGGGRLAVERLHVEAAVEEGIAVVDVDETFRNPGDRAAEGVWTFRLPADAVIGSLSMRMGGVEKRGQVLEARH